MKEWELVLIGAVFVLALAFWVRIETLCPHWIC
jgi:hypothetical protein